MQTKKQSNRKGGASLFLSSKDSDGGLKLDTACIQRQLICFYQDQGQGNPVEAVKSAVFSWYHVVFSHISPI